MLIESQIALTEFSFMNLQHPFIDQDLKETQWPCCRQEVNVVLPLFPMSCRCFFECM